MRWVQQSEGLWTADGYRARVEEVHHPAAPAPFFASVVCTSEEVAVLLGSHWSDSLEEAITLAILSVDLEAQFISLQEANKV